MNLREDLKNHKNNRYLLQEIFNGTSQFLNQSFYQTRLWEGEKEVKENLKKIVETYLSTRIRVEYELKQIRKTYKEFLSDEETVHQTMDYLARTLAGGNGSISNGGEYNLIPLWIALNEREEDFYSFYEELKNIEPVTMKEALITYWLYYFNSNDERIAENAQ